MSNNRVRVSETGWLHIDLNGIVRDILRKTREGIEAAKVARGENNPRPGVPRSIERLESDVVTFVGRKLKRVSFVTLRDLAQIPLRRMAADERRALLDDMVSRGILVEGESFNIRGPKAPIYTLPGTHHQIVDGMPEKLIVGNTVPSA